MSWKATSYVKGLDKCPDGAPMTRGMKLLLSTLADYHHNTLKLAWPSMGRLAPEAKCSVDQIRRDLNYLELHLVVARVYPEVEGRGHTLSYEFLELDNPEELERLLEKGCMGAALSSSGDDREESGPDLEKGGTGATLAAARRVAEGLQVERERGAEGLQGARPYKEEPVNKELTGEHSTPDGAINDSPEIEPLKYLPLETDRDPMIEGLEVWLEIRDEFRPGQVMRWAYPERGLDEEWTTEDRVVDEEEWNLWVRTARLRAVRPGPDPVLMVVVPPTARIFAAATARRDDLRKKALERDYDLVLRQDPDYWE
jgi:hypothetical protein